MDTFSLNVTNKERGTTIVVMINRPFMSYVSQYLIHSEWCPMHGETRLLSFIHPYYFIGEICLHQIHFTRIYQ